MDWFGAPEEHFSYVFVDGQWVSLHHNLKVWDVDHLEDDVLFRDQQ